MLSMLVSSKLQHCCFQSPSCFPYHLAILYKNGYALVQRVQSILSVAEENHHHFFVRIDFDSNAYRLEGSSTSDGILFLPISVHNKTSVVVRAFDFGIHTYFDSEKTNVISTRVWYSTAKTNVV